MQVRTPIAVRYGETDMMGVVYHANYLLYFEDARTHFLEEVGVPYTTIEQAGYMCPIYHVEISYGAPLRYGEAAFVITSVAKNTPTKTTYRQLIYRDGMNPEVDRPLAEGLITCCMVERATFKPVSIKRAMPDLYELYGKIAEAPDGK